MPRVRIFSSLGRLAAAGAATAVVAGFAAAGTTASAGENGDDFRQTRLAATAGGSLIQQTAATELPVLPLPEAPAAQPVQSAQPSSISQGMPNLLPTVEAKRLTPAPSVRPVGINGGMRNLTVSQQAVTPAGTVVLSTIAPGGALGMTPRLDAPLYSSPRPNIPYQVGGTAITNQALAPHEMLYEHDYYAIYPPYYYKVRGGWFLTPRGVFSHDTLQLKGTEVRVKYRKKAPWHAKWVHPVVKH